MKMHLVDTLEGRDGLALVLVEGSIDDAAVLELDVGRLGVVLERESVLHPVLVITLDRIVLGHKSSQQHVESGVPPGSPHGREHHETPCEPQQRQWSA